MRRVSLHKTVLNFALALVGLISSFRHFKLSYIVLVIVKYLVYYTSVFRFRQGVFHIGYRFRKFLWKSLPLLAGFYNIK